VRLGARKPFPAFTPNMAAALTETQRWVESMAAVDMGLTLGDWNVCINMQKTLLASEPLMPADLAGAWCNIYGNIPPLVDELVNVRRCDDVGALALVMARVHYTFLKLPSHRAQVREAATARLTHALHRVHRQKGYIRTHAKIMAMTSCSHEEAAAHAYFLHSPASLAGGESAVPDLEVCAHPPATADHLNLPLAYLGVDMDGKLVLLDASRGASVVEVCSRVPHNWMVRISAHTNEFLAGDATCCLHLTLNEPLTMVLEKPVALPRYPPARAHEVDNSWVVWFDANKRARALAWDAQAQRATLCSAADAELHAVTGEAVYSRGNEVWRGTTCIARLPSTESITAINGTPTAFDAFTQGGDWWRVDVRARKAWVVGVPAANIVCTIAALVGWS